MKLSVNGMIVLAVVLGVGAGLFYMRMKHDKEKKLASAPGATALDKHTG